jgi:putative IMPACT (imprinted ancient) family translation regulator
MQVRDVVVVVSRWYGGTLLGPMRFTLINNAARILLEDCGYDKRDMKAASRSSR